MIDTIAASRYTRALFELAEKESRLAETDQALTHLKNLLETHPEILRLVANPTLSDEEKFELIRKILPKTIPELLTRFLKVLLEKKRFALLPAIQALFDDLFDKKRGIEEVEMISPVPLSAAFQEKLKAVLQKKLRSQIQLISKIDARLIGGFVLHFDDKEIDCSFRNRIHEIQQRLFGSFAEEGGL